MDPESKSFDWQNVLLDIKRANNSIEAAKAQISSFPIGYANLAGWELLVSIQMLVISSSMELLKYVVIKPTKKYYLQCSSGSCDVIERVSAQVGTGEITDLCLKFPGINMRDSDLTPVDILPFIHGLYRIPSSPTLFDVYKYIDTVGLSHDVKK